jgi:hypothetical protein
MTRFFVIRLAPAIAGDTADEPLAVIMDFSGRALAVGAVRQRNLHNGPHRRVTDKYKGYLG